MLFEHFGFLKKNRETTHKVIVDPGVKPPWGWKINRISGIRKILNFAIVQDFTGFCKNLQFRILKNLGFQEIPTFWEPPTTNP